MKVSWTKTQPRDDRGVALIAAVMAVAVLLAIGLSFAFNMRLEEKCAANYMYGMKAKYLAKAGVARAVAALKIYANNSNYLWANYSTLAQGWAVGYSGTIEGGEFDVRYTRTIAGTGDENNTLLDVQSDGDVNGHIIRGIIDEESKININTAQNDLLEGLPGIGDSKANDIIGGRPYLTIAQVITADNIGLGIFYGDDENDNHLLDSNENDGVDDDADGVLDGGIEDLITVSSPTITDPAGGGIDVSPVNVNTANERVLRAVISTASVGIPDVGEATRDKVVKAIIEYRTGKDYDDGSNIGGGNPNPFDGIDSNRGDGIDPTVTGFSSDGLDNDGDDDGSDDAEDTYLFAGGARGEFNALIDYLRSNGYHQGAAISSDAARDNIKDNADPSSVADYDGDGNPECWTTPFCFRSTYFQIISEGTALDPAGNVAASCKIERIVGPIE
ncbi:hypothetical protein KAW55_08000 [bacterium]|nr:hypothetical protein [bacterium]